MNSPELIEIRFDNIRTFDWYDGLVRAIGFNGELTYLIILVAWDKKSDLKTYILVPLEMETAKRLLELVDQSSYDSPNKELLWDKLSDSIKEFLENYQGHVYLSTCEPVCGVNTLVKVIVTSHLSQLSSYSCESSLGEDSIKYWRSVIF